MNSELTTEGRFNGRMLRKCVQNYLVISSHQQCFFYRAFQSLIGKIWKKCIFSFLMSFDLKKKNTSFNPEFQSFIFLFYFAVAKKLIKNRFCLSTDVKDRGYSETRKSCQHQNQSCIHKRYLKTNIIMRKYFYGLIDE